MDAHRLRYSAKFSAFSDVLRSYSCYKSLIIKSFYSQFIYRSNLLLNLVSGFLLLVVQASVWQALYKQGAHSGATLSDSITYIVLSTVVLQKLQMCPGETVGLSVYNGDLGIDMIRPVSLLMLHICNQAGKAMFSALTYTMPTLIIACVIYGVQPPAGIGAFFAFLLTSALGLILYMLFDSVIGYSAFWLMNNWYMAQFERAFIVLFGGTIVPFWFYPAALTNISRWLPFQYFVAVPINFYLGKIQSSLLIHNVLIQLLWIAVFLASERLIWKAAQQKIMVQGG